MTASLGTRARMRAALLLFAFRAVSALVLAYPVARTIAAFSPPVFPVADGLLFAPGAFYAVEALRLGGRAIEASVESSALAFVFVAIVASFPFAVALSALVHPDESLPSLAKRGAEGTPSLVAIGGAAALSQAVGLAAIAGATASLSGSFDTAMDERQADLTRAGLALVASACLVGVGLLADLARAAVVRRGVRAVPAIVLSFERLRRVPGAVLVAWLPPAAASLALVAGAAWAASAVDVSRPGAGRVWAVALMHQVAVFAIVALRVYWLERALHVVGEDPRDGDAKDVSGADTPSLAGTPARSDEPDDPTPDPAA